MIWVTSDTHFGHRQIIQYCARPFSSREEMDEKLVENWNKRVKPKDDVYHLGDFCFGSRARCEELLEKLNGKIHLILGNHDKAIWKTESLRDRFVWVKDLHTLKWAGNRYILCHYPLLTWEGAHRGVYHLHGHSHGNLRAPETTRLDMGVDCWDYAPVDIDTIAETLSERKYKGVDHHG